MITSSLIILSRLVVAVIAATTLIGIVSGLGVIVHGHELCRLRYVLQGDEGVAAEGLVVSEESAANIAEEVLLTQLLRGKARDCVTAGPIVADWISDIVWISTGLHQTTLSGITKHTE